jgi:parallel beta-helix repeat protein
MASVVVSLLVAIVIAVFVRSQADRIVAVDPSMLPQVGPTGISCPQSSVLVEVGENIQRAIRPEPPGTIFCLEEGTHRPTALINPKNDQQFIGQIGGKVVIEGPGAPSFPLFDGLETSATGVVLRGLVIDGFGNEEFPAVRGNTDWVIERNEIRDATVAVNPGEGTGAKVLNNYLHHSGTGIGAFRGRDALIEENEVAHNSGDQKFVGTIGTIVRGNYYHDNGAGIWMDGGNDSFLIENNIVIGTDGRRGIENEAGCSGVIRNNLSAGNDLAGIMITASQGNEVYGNIVKDNGEGIVVWHQDRRDEPGSGQICDWWLEDIYIHDNTITMDEGFTGVLSCCGGTDDPTFLEDNVRFTDNDYRVDSEGEHFRWLHDSLTFDQWQELGYDSMGSLHQEGS